MRVRMRKEKPNEEDEIEINLFDWKSLNQIHYWKSVAIHLENCSLSKATTSLRRPRIRLLIAKIESKCIRSKEKINWRRKTHIQTFLFRVFRWFGVRMSSALSFPVFSVCFFFFCCNGAHRLYNLRQRRWRQRRVCWRKSKYRPKRNTEKSQHDSILLCAFIRIYSSYLELIKYASAKQTLQRARPESNGDFESKSTISFLRQYHVCSST